MKIPPPFDITSEMIELITKIEANKIHLSSLQISSMVKDKIQRKSLLKSSLYSARIEGNPLEIGQVSEKWSNEKNKIEVLNIIQASRFIESLKNSNEVTKENILSIHRKVLSSIDDSSGHIRNEQSAIFNESGVAVYIPPSPQTASKLMDELVGFINVNEIRFPLITAFLSHLVFEKIHPFMDGNGRVGRLLISLVLRSKGWSTNFIVSFEEYLDENKSEYYFYLDQGILKTNDYLVFMLTAYLSQIEKIKEQIAIEMNEMSAKEIVFLPPRQEEILSIISDHKLISFDMIKRRFIKVPARTLRYDIKKLMDKGLVEKIGETKGVYYRKI